MNTKFEKIFPLKSDVTQQRQILSARFFSNFVFSLECPNFICGEGKNRRILNLDLRPGFDILFILDSYGWISVEVVITYSLEAFAFPIE